MKCLHSGMAFLLLGSELQIKGALVPCPSSKPTKERGDRWVLNITSSTSDDILTRVARHLGQVASLTPCSQFKPWSCPSEGRFGSAKQTHLTKISAMN